MERIVVLTRLDFEIAGGGRAERLARALAGEGYDVAVVARNPGAAAVEEDRGFRLLRPMPDPGARSPGALRYLAADPEIGRAAASLSPDAVVATDPVTLRQAVAVRAATGAGVVYDSWESYADQIEQTVPHRWFRPLLVALLRRQTIRAERRALPHVAAVVVTSEGHGDLLRARYGSRLPTVALVRNCPPLSDPEPGDHLRRATGAGPEEKILVYAGSLAPSRGLLPMLEAARRLGEGHRLAVLGWGWLTEEMRRRAPGNTTILPPVPADRLISVLAGADAGLLPIEPRNASKRESLANKLFEYLMAGLPVVATDLPGHRRVLAGTGAGVLVPEASPDALAAGVREVLDAERTSAMRRAARTLARDRYHLEAEMPELCRAVEAALHSSRKGFVAKIANSGQNARR